MLNQTKVGCTVHIPFMKYKLHTLKKSLEVAIASGLYLLYQQYNFIFITKDIIT